MDDLKKYVDQHREEFEVYDSEFDGVWDKVQQGLDKQPTGKIRFLNIAWKVAASIVLVLGISFLLLRGNINNQLRTNGIALTNVSDDMADTEAYYTQLINEKLEVIHHLSDDATVMLDQQLSIFDEDYSGMKKDLQDNADSEEVINAMIEFYRLKLSMLEHILTELEKNKERDNNDQGLSI